MKAMYFRLMYQNVEGGILHTVSVLNTQTDEAWNGCYICTGKESEDVMRMDARFAYFGKKIDLIVIERYQNENLRTAIELLSKNDIEMMVLPGENEEICKKLKKAGAKNILCLKEGENYQTGGAGWFCELEVFGSGKNASIVMYHDADRTCPQKQDAVLMVKAFSENLPCSAAIVGDDHHCAMRCCLYNDFDICKGHNDRNRENYVCGTLLLGNLDIKKYENKLKEKFRRHENVRFYAFMGSHEIPDWRMKNKKSQIESADWKSLNDEKINKYFVMPGTVERKYEDTALKIIRGNLRNRLVMTSEKDGLCATGFFTKMA